MTQTRIPHRLKAEGKSQCETSGNAHRRHHWKGPRSHMLAIIAYGHSKEELTEDVHLVLGKRMPNTSWTIAMGTKMAVAFDVIFMAHIDKQLMATSSNKSLIWKRFISVDLTQSRNQQLYWFPQLFLHHNKIHAWNVVGKDCFPWYRSF